MRQLPSNAWSLLALGWALLLWGLLTASEVPGVSLVGPWVPAVLRPWQDKVAHGALFLVQALLLERAAVDRLGRWRALLLAMVACVALGAATELRQWAVPGRDADTADFLADALGAAAYAVVLPISRRLERPRAAA